jgi:deazaflavin-dependent oxidoreductase (nitroreductase family)
MKKHLFGLLNSIAKQKGFQAKVPGFFHYGGWLFMYVNRLVGFHSLLLTTTGRKSGKQHTVALGAVKQGEDYLVMAPFGPSGRYPDWFLNLKNNPKVTTEIFWRKREVLAEEIADEAERLDAMRCYGLGMFDFVGAEERNGKKIPVVRLRPLAG